MFPSGKSKVVDVTDSSITPQDVQLFPHDRSHAKTLNLIAAVQTFKVSTQIKLWNLEAIKLLLVIKTVYFFSILAKLTFRELVTLQRSTFN